MSLKDISVRYSPLSERILFARFGRDKNVALETRDAMSEVLQVLVQYAYGDGKMPQVGDCTEVMFGGGNEQFKLTLERIEAKK